MKNIGSSMIYEKMHSVASFIKKNIITNIVKYKDDIASIALIVGIIAAGLFFLITPILGVIALFIAATAFVVYYFYQGDETQADFYDKKYNEIVINKKKEKLKAVNIENKKSFVRNEMRNNSHNKDLGIGGV